jgi:hypothetical protein
MLNATAPFPVFRPGVWLTESEKSRKTGLSGASSKKRIKRFGPSVLVEKGLE